MDTRRSDNLLLAPLLVVAALAAHAAAYLTAEPDAAARAVLLAESGHGYIRWTPALVGAAGLLLVVALALRALRAARGILGDAPHPLLALVPVAGFVVQEPLERLVAGGASPALFAERTFLVGLALQLAFGLVALALARLLGRRAERLGLHAARRAAVRARPLPISLRPAPAFVPRPAPLASRSAGRAPPSLTS